jgi:hypothetical protein
MIVLTSITIIILIMNVITMIITIDKLVINYLFFLIFISLKKWVGMLLLIK